MNEYLADEVSYYYSQYEPESLFVAEVIGEIDGALLRGKTHSTLSNATNAAVNLIKPCGI